MEYILKLIVNKALIIYKTSKDGITDWRRWRVFRGEPQP
jgi:hypothetical protein